MKRKTYISFIAAAMTVLLMLLVSSARAASPIEIELINSQTTYLPTEQIKMQVDVRNKSGGEVIAQEGFLNQDFHLMITFTDPDGRPVTTHFKDVGYEGGPPYRYNDRDAVVVESIPAGAKKTVVIEDAKTFYNLTKYGRYTASVIAHLETYSQATADPNTDKSIAYLSDQISSDTVRSNEVSFVVQPPAPAVQSPIQANVSLLKIGTGTKPPVVKRPLDGVKDGVSVRLYKQSDLQKYEPTNWKKYSLIWNDLHIRPFQVAQPDSTGKAIFNLVPKDDYLMITVYDSIYEAASVKSNAVAWGKGTLREHLMIIQKSCGAKVPAKTMEQNGSYLLIVEPEYIEWDSSQELYPFIFEASGDWDITTALALPEGFVADYNALSTRVKDSTAAIQFTVGDVGTRWVESDVTFTVTHKKKVKVLKDKIGIKLDRKLAAKKRLSIYGETGGPGIFHGGEKKSP